MEDEKISIALAILSLALGLDSPEMGMLAMRGPDSDGDVEIRIMMRVNTEPPEVPKATADTLVDEIQSYLESL